MHADFAGSMRRSWVLAIGSIGAIYLSLAITPAAQAGERVLWRFRTEGFSTGRFVTIAPDGTIYTSSNTTLYAINPDGTEKWSLHGAGGSRPISLGTDGTIYTGGSLIKAVNPDGTLRWQFENPRPGLALAAGPGVGPDGNIYAAQDTDDDPDALGIFSLDPDGNLRWATRTDYPMIRLRARSNAAIQFSSDRMYVTIHRRASTPPTIRTYDFDGDLLWYSPDLDLAVGGGPVIHPFTGSLIVRWAQTGMQSLSPDGDVEWIREHPGRASLVVGPDIGVDGTIYAGDWLGTDWWALDGDGDTLWFGPSTGEMLSRFAITPDSTQLVAGVADAFGQPGTVRSYDPDANGAFLWRVNLPTENDLLQFVSGRPVFTSDGGTAYIPTSFTSDAQYGYLYAFDLSLEVDTDCDGVSDSEDNCPDVYNPFQGDRDDNGIGDACDIWVSDDCDDAFVMCPGTIEGVTTGATPDGASSCNGFPELNPDVWYKYTPERSGTVEVDTCGSNWWNYLSVHAECPGTVENQIDCDASDCARVTFEATEGETYLIRITGFAANEIEFTLNLSGPPCIVDPPIPGDLDGDGDVDLIDYANFARCVAGPGVATPPACCDAESFDRADLDGDGDVDVADFSTLAGHFSG